ncbi:MAG TPA: winged helix-turn-helix transcriptional regulator [Anaerolineales bacterium]|jgi:DNA-binding Lrp family transcriptional regulator
MGRKPWTFITNHGAVLGMIGQTSQITARLIASKLDITERTVLRIIKDLEGAGYVKRERFGRENRYTVNASLPLRRSDQHAVEIGQILKVLKFK